LREPSLGHTLLLADVGCFIQTPCTLFFVCLPCVCVCLFVCSRHVQIAHQVCGGGARGKRVLGQSPPPCPLRVIFPFIPAPTCALQHSNVSYACALFFVAAVPGSHTLDAHCTMSCPAEQNSGKITSYVNYVLANARGVLILSCCFQCLDVQEGEGSGECPLFLCQLHRCLALNCGWECMSCESSSFVVLGSA
jgi:hypothetical protein